MTTDFDTKRETPDECELDLEGEWADAREAAGLEVGWVTVGGRPPASSAHAEVSPYVLLYSGFLLGPAATLLVAFVLMARRFEARAAIFSLGVCGAAWSMIQAATFGLAGQWSSVELQVLRTGGNFLVGLLLFVFLRRYTAVPLTHDRQTLINTVVVGLLLLVGYASLSPETLVWLGR